MKVFWFDTETTGLDPYENDIIQIAGIVEIDGSVAEEFNFTCAPSNPNNIDPKALEVNKLRREDILKYEPPGVMLKWKLLPLLNKYIQPHDKKDKFLMAGWNTQFDMRFLRKFWKKNNEDYFGSWFEWVIFDVMVWYVGVEICTRHPYEDHKLVSIAAANGIHLDAHDALNDIRVTRELYWKSLETLNHEPI